MLPFELTNEQRVFFGLDPIEDHWDRVLLKGDKYRPETMLYFDKDVIKRHIVSTANKYSESHYDEMTRERTILLPKTNKGKEKKLTASVLEQRQPTGVYLNVNNVDLTVGNYNTQTTFYSSQWARRKQDKEAIPDSILEFIERSPKNHLAEIGQFKRAQRKHIKFKSGDYFCFKLDRTNFGFGRLLLDVGKVCKGGLIGNYHGLRYLMGQALIVELFAFSWPTKDVSLSTLDNQPKLPSDVMFDNLLLYGEYEIIGRREIKEEEFNFPISYGAVLEARPAVFLQWGLIHKELPKTIFNKYTMEEAGGNKNPYGFYGVGFRPSYDTVDVVKTIENNGVFDFDKCRHYKAKQDLRNPNNKAFKEELFNVFGLDPNKSYIDNCILTGTVRTNELIKKLGE